MLFPCRALDRGFRGYWEAFGRRRTSVRDGTALAGEQPTGRYALIRRVGEHSGDNAARADAGRAL